MAYRVEHRRRAERDLDTLAKTLGPERFEMICDAIESLAMFPERCALAPEGALRIKGIRNLLCGSGFGRLPDHLSGSG